jgi:hypothetical protein
MPGNGEGISLSLAAELTNAAQAFQPDAASFLLYHSSRRTSGWKARPAPIDEHKLIHFEDHSPKRFIGGTRFRIAEDHEGDGFSLLSLPV